MAKKPTKTVKPGGGKGVPTPTPKPTPTPSPGAAGDYAPGFGGGGNAGGGTSTPTGPGIEEFSTLDTSGPNWVPVRVKRGSITITFFRNTNNNRVADAQGRFVGQWGNGAINFFKGGGTSTPDPGDGEEGGEDGGEDEPGEDDERPDEPPPVPGYKWVWNEDTGWTAVKDAATPDLGAQDSLRAELRTILDQFGLATEGNIALLERAVQQDWSPTKFVQELRQSTDYLANPLFAANVQRAKEGKGFMPEGQVIGYAAEAKRLARQHGFAEPSDSYIANGFQGGMSLAEYEHRLNVQQRVNLFGPGVATVYKFLTGDDPSDQDLFDIFNPEKSTQWFVDQARAAEMRGRPMVLGLGIRSAEEAAALDLLGVTPDQAFEGYQRLANALPTVTRLAAIDQTIANDPENPFDSFGALFKDIFQSDAKSQEQILLMTARERARFKQGATATQGQLAGLLTGAEKQNYS